MRNVYAQDEDFFVQLIAEKTAKAVQTTISSRREDLTIDLLETWLDYSWAAYQKLGGKKVPRELLRVEAV